MNRLKSLGLFECRLRSEQALSLRLPSGSCSSSLSNPTHGKKKLNLKEGEHVVFDSERPENIKTTFNLGDTFPNFQCHAFGVDGVFDFYEYTGNHWIIFFSHPADFTPVCTTELGTAAKLWRTKEFPKRKCKLLGLSCNDTSTHHAWSIDIMACQTLPGPLPFPIVADPKRELATRLGILDPVEKDAKGSPVSCRACFFVGPDKRVKALILYPATTGRSFHEIIRVLDSLQITMQYPIATPESWDNGAKCMVVPHLTDEETKIHFPKGVVKVEVPSGRNYLRFTADPRNGEVGCAPEVASVNYHGLHTHYLSREDLSLSEGRKVSELPTRTGFNLGDTFPNIVAVASGVENNKLDLYKYLGDSWGVFFSHPADFTPVCTTELGKAAKLFRTKEFSNRNAKVIGLSCDDLQSHNEWSKDVLDSLMLPGDELPFPVIADKDRSIARQLQIIDPDEKDVGGMPLTCRSVFFISPNKKIASITLYPATTGRQFEEILRVLDSLKVSLQYPIATPEGWKRGNKVMIVPELSDEEAEKRFPKGITKFPVPSGKNYVRFTPDPQ